MLKEILSHSKQCSRDTLLSWMALMLIFTTGLLSVRLFLSGGSFHPKHIYVVGLESSGTRYLALTIAAAILDGAEVKWDGANPRCFPLRNPSRNQTYHLNHLSLPQGTHCQGKLDVLTRIPNHCQVQRGIDSPRWFLNVTDQILNTPNSYLIIIVRDFTLSLFSKVQRKHCSNMSLAYEEHLFGMTLLSEAMDKLAPSRVHMMSYEMLEYFPETIFEKLWAFLGIVTSHKPKFRNNNVKHIEMPSDSDSDPEAARKKLQKKKRRRERGGFKNVDMSQVDGDVQSFFENGLNSDREAATRYSLQVPREKRHVRVSSRGTLVFLLGFVVVLVVLLCKDC